MGSSSYSFSDRSARADSLGYLSKSASDIFEQNKVGKIHESMNPKVALLRESRDSDTHPHSIPIILGMDVTGSMGHIPHFLVKDGLPKLMSNIINKGIPDPQILFIPFGDHVCDSAPLQVGQFESGDEELDLWLTRTYIEGGGGGNEGESYLLPWYFAGYHTVTDAWEKRNEKGFLFTIGDEPCISNLPVKVIDEIMGSVPNQLILEQKNTLSHIELLEKAKERYHVFHIHMLEGSAGKRSRTFWENLMGENCVIVNDHTTISDVISNIVTSVTLDGSFSNVSTGGYSDGINVNII